MNIPNFVHFYLGANYRPLAVGVVELGFAYAPPYWCTQALYGAVAWKLTEIDEMVICAVVNCHNRSDKGESIRFFRLPAVITHQGNSSVLRGNRSGYLRSIEKTLLQKDTRMSESVPYILFQALLLNYLTKQILTGHLH